MPQLLKPPAVPAAILNFFASQPDFPAVAGDISEEFQQRAQKSGPQAAKRWYWREAFRNANALTWRELARTPLWTTLTAFSCFAAVNAVLSLVWKLGPVSGPGPWDVFAIHMTTLLTVGFIGGKLLRGREWALALTFAALSISIAGGLRWFFPAPRIGFSASQFAAVVVGTSLRLGVFWLGCLGIRMIRVHSRSIAARSTAAGTPRSSAPRNPPDLS